MNKDEIKKILQQNILNLIFEKTDGSKRSMKCTLKEELLPITESKKETTKKENVNVIPVWDLEKKAFRSFRIDSIISYHII